MTHLFRQLQRLESRNQSIRTAVIGAGFMGRGLIYQLCHTPGMFPSLLVVRDVNKGVDAYRTCGFNPQDIIVSDNRRVLEDAVQKRRPAITPSIDVATSVIPIDVFIDATVGPILKQKADAAGIVYTNADGDQPGVLMRLIEYCRGCGFEVRCAVNCKGFMNIRATPDSIKEWAIKQNTSPRMTTAFTDGTKMNIELNVVCNAANLLPAKRGMIGVKTDLKNALKDFQDSGALIDYGTVDYTLAGDFAGGVFVIARAEHPEMVKPYLCYLKMGDGPDFLFYRPYHLCHIETPLS